jgi:hypothetical protein
MQSLSEIQGEDPIRHVDVKIRHVDVKRRPYATTGALAADTAAEAGG